MLLDQLWGELKRRGGPLTYGLARRMERTLSPVPSAHGASLRMQPRNTDGTLFPLGMLGMEPLLIEPS